MGRIKNTLLAIILSAAALLGTAGCKISGPVIPRKQRGPVYAGINARAALTPTFYDLDIDSKYINPHPDDVGFITGVANVKARDGVDAFRGSLGLEGEIGTKRISLTAGSDVTFSLTKYNDLNKDTSLGLQRMKQHDGDPRPGENGSLVYDRVDPPVIGIRPFIGTRARLEDYTINAELGFPRGKWRREWGHHRFNREDKLGSVSDTAWGIRPSIEVTKRIDDTFSVGAGAAYEKWNLKFGDVDGFTGYLFFSF